MRGGTDDDVARPRRAPYAAPNNTRDSAAGPYREAGRPYKGPDLPYPPIQGGREAGLPEKTWEECTLLPKKRPAPKIFSSSNYFVLLMQSMGSITI